MGVTGRLYDSFRLQFEVPRFARWAAPYVIRGKLPPDLTVRGPSNRCYMVDHHGRWGDWACTRRPWHGGRHAAGDGKYVRAVW